MSSWEDRAMLLCSEASFDQLLTLEQRMHNEIEHRIARAESAVERALADKKRVYDSLDDARARQQTVSNIFGSPAKELA